MYHLNSSGKYFAFKEQLKHSVIKIVREKYLRTTNFDDRQELQVRSITLIFKKQILCKRSTLATFNLLCSMFIKLWYFEASFIVPYICHSYKSLCGNDVSCLRS